MAEEVRTRLIAIQSTNQASHKITQPATATALPLAVEHLRHKRSLVFLVSDFHLPDALINQTLISLSSHDVIPLVIWDSAEYSNIPNWGWARVRDMEGGEYRSLFLRQALIEKIKASYVDRRRIITSLCLKAGTRAPFFIEDIFKAERLTRHLLEAN